MKMSILFSVLVISFFTVSSVNGQVSLSVVNSIFENLGNAEYIAKNLDPLQELLLQGINKTNEVESSDVNATTPELIKKYGYPLETHEVETSDGYLLSVYRIPYGRKLIKQSNPSVPKPAVLLLHCSFIDSASWLLLGEKSLGFALADADYDVWLLNARGTTYSRHKSLSTNDPKFWDNTWHEWGTEDLPAAIDYVLAKTNNQKLSYIGYSAGATALFVMLSEKPEYNDKITTMVAYAPLVYEKHVRSAPMHAFSRVAESLLNFVKMSRNIDFLSLRGPVNMVRRICQDPQFFDALCLPLLNAQYGWNNEQEDKDLAPVFVNHITTTPLKLMVHYAQNIVSKRFQKYKDPLEVTNMRKYGQLNPPEYEIKNAEVPTAIYYSTNDPFAVPEDVEILIKMLPNVTAVDKISANKFDHVSFLWGKDAPDSLYKSTIAYLDKMNNEKLRRRSSKG